MFTIETLSQFPRPDMVREHFTLLDGEWRFEFDAKDKGMGEKWFEKPLFSKKIIVPFCVESKVSGVGVENPPKRMWYAKEFSLPVFKEKHEKMLLHFGAVDYKAAVWLNGCFLGKHEGGYTPFYFAVEKLARGKNLLVVRVDDSRSPKQPRGKQTFMRRPVAVFYAGVTGIWESVWIEKAGITYLGRFMVNADCDKKSADFTCFLLGDEREGELLCEIYAPDGECVKHVEHFKFSGTNGDKELERFKFAFCIPFDKIHLWSVETPNLYRVKFTVRCGDSVDEVKSYFGFRKIEARGNKIYLNDKPLYQKLVLVQGYFPDGHYTPVDDGQYKRDVELVKELGFNGVRMHEKIEHKKFLFWCDVLGCLVWDEMPSAQLYCKDMRNAVKEQWREIIERDINHPCIITWVPMNESWGVGVFPVPLIVSKNAREFVKELYRFTKDLDPSRLVVDNSGYDHTDETDIVDIHHYLGSVEKCKAFYEKLRHIDTFKFSWHQLPKSVNPANTPMQTFTRDGKYKGQSVLISEYGGFGFYKTKTGKSLLENFSDYTKLIQEQDFICGYCYTQLYDTFQEKNGLLNFSRAPKVGLRDIKNVNDGRNS